MLTRTRTSVRYEKLNDRVSVVNPDIVEASRLLARAILELAEIFEDLYVPDDPDEPINQALHDEVARVLFTASQQLSDYVERAQTATRSNPGSVLN